MQVIPFRINSRAFPCLSIHSMQRSGLKCRRENRRESIPPQDAPRILLLQCERVFSLYNDLRWRTGRQVSILFLPGKCDTISTTLEIRKALFGNWIRARGLDLGCCDSRRLFRLRHSTYPRRSTLESTLQMPLQWFNVESCLALGIVVHQSLDDGASALFD